MAGPERTDHLDSPATVGIVGAGQLARMLCEAASALGIRTTVLAADRDDAATATASEVLVGAATDAVALGELARRSSVVTFDHELVDLDALAALEAAGVLVRPSTAALAAAVDKAHQRRSFQAAGLPVPRFCVLEGDREGDLAALEALASELGHVPVVKAARGGYDGRGVVVADALSSAVAAVEAWRASGVPVVAEARCEFRFELAALVARRPGGELVQWRTVETDQLGGVCREVCVPGAVDAATERAAAALAARVAAHLSVVGILAVELFDTSEGLVVNEVAVRPHNSGHWTMEGSTTSQFENHLRAVLDLPLGATDVVAPAVCSVNVFGAPDASSPSSLAAALAEPTAKVHLYGKAPRPGRKLGHVTVVGTDASDVAARAWRAAAALGTPVAASSGARP